MAKQGDLVRIALHNQGVKLPSGRRSDSLCRFPLTFPDHVHHFDAAQNDAGATKILEVHHRFEDAFDGTVVLLDEVVQILVLADFNGRC